MSTSWKKQKKGRKKFSKYLKKCKKQLIKRFKTKKRKNIRMNII